ncbi:MAG TPA: hypothetical protein VFF27_16975 [Bacteroidia bacterium]|jgi:hypothetical protein|nr:hypothetical protein [Bacteroidia bacterium]
MRFLQQNYDTIRSFLLNGTYAYALYGCYAVTVAPLLSGVLNKGEHTKFIGIFGIIILIAEFFALNFKLKMVRIRAHEKQLLLKQQTGQATLPSIGGLVLFAFFLRLVFRLGIVMTILMALGYEGRYVPSEVIVLFVLFFDLLWFAYIYMKKDIYTDVPDTKREFNEEVKADEDWYKENTASISGINYFRRELISDFILQIYGLILFCSFWEYMNRAAIERLHGEMRENTRVVETLVKIQGFHSQNLYTVDAGTGVAIIMLLFVTAMLGLMPIRIAYWVEDSMTSFTKKERLSMWVIFGIAAIYTCSPFLLEYISMVGFGFQPYSVPEYVQHLVTVSFFFTLLLLQLFWIGKKEQ